MDDDNASWAEEEEEEMGEEKWANQGLGGNRAGKEGRCPRAPKCDVEDVSDLTQKEDGVDEIHERRKLIATEGDNGGGGAAGEGGGADDARRGDNNKTEYAVIPAWDPVGIEYGEMEFIDIRIEGEEEI